MSETTGFRHVKIAGRPYALRRRDVERALRKVEPEPITSHFVVVGAQRFPPKQVISVVTGLDRADFTSHQARRTLMRLGFTAGRRGTARRSRRAAEGPVRSDYQPAQTASLAERLGPLAGQWVATKDDDVLHAADTPQELVGWLARHGQRADSMFRVPEDDRAASGLALL